MGNLFPVMAGGALDAGLRHRFGRATNIAFASAFPWETPGVNLIGGQARGGGGAAMRLLPGVGVPGGFTAFSAFSLDTAMLIVRGQAGIAPSCVATSVAGPIGALAVGLHPARGAAA